MWKLSRVSRYLLVAIMAIFSAIFLSGCSSDKIVGNYVDYHKAPGMMGFHSFDKIKVLKIEKNGDAYLVKEITYSYKVKDSSTPKDSNGFVTDNFDYTFISEESKPQSATLKDNILTTSKGFKITFVEKDDSLLYSDDTFKRITDEKKLTSYKEEMQSRIKETLEKNYADTEKRQQDPQWRAMNKIFALKKLGKITFIDKDTFDEAVK